MLLNFIPFIGNNEAGDIFCKRAGGGLFAQPVFREVLVLSAPFVPALRWRWLLHVFLKSLNVAQGRPFPAGHTKDTVDLRGTVGLGVFRQIGHRTTLCFLFKPGGGQNVDSGSDLSSNRIPGPGRLFSAVKIVIRC